MLVGFYRYLVKWGGTWRHKGFQALAMTEAISRSVNKVKNACLEHCMQGFIQNIFSGTELVYVLLGIS